MSDFISKYYDIVSLISRGSSEYSILGRLAICKENLGLRLRNVKFQVLFYKGLLLRLVSFGELGL